MRLRCTVCNDEFLLAKYYPKLTSGWFVPATTPEAAMKTGIETHGDFLARLGLFLERHSYCNEAGTVTMYGNTRFDLTFAEPEIIVEEAK